MRTAIILTFDLPDPERITHVLTEIDPPKLPYFEGSARIAVEPHVSQLLAWLDDEGTVLDRMQPTKQQSRAIADVIAERQRQTDLGYTAEHDDEHGLAHFIEVAASEVNSPYPTRAELVKAAATLIAAIEHIDRTFPVLAPDHSEDPAPHEHVPDFIPRRHPHHTNTSGAVYPGTPKTAAAEAFPESPNSGDGS